PAGPEQAPSQLRARAVPRAAVHRREADPSHGRRCCEPGALGGRPWDHVPSDPPSHVSVDRPGEADRPGDRCGGGRPPGLAVDPPPAHDALHDDLRAARTENGAEVRVAPVDETQAGDVAPDASGHAARLELRVETRGDLEIDAAGHAADADSPLADSGEMEVEAAGDRADPRLPYRGQLD